MSVEGDRWGGLETVNGTSGGSGGLGRHGQRSIWHEKEKTEQKGRENGVDMGLKMRKKREQGGKGELRKILPG